MITTCKTTRKKAGILVCGSYQAVENWIQRLRTIGMNYFVIFQDVRGPALQFGYAGWAERDCLGGYYVCR